jgi:hypothetical protein
MRKYAPEPTIHTLVCCVFCNFDVLNTCAIHANIARIIITPAIEEKIAPNMDAVAKVCHPCSHDGITSSENAENVVNPPKAIYNTIFIKILHGLYTKRLNLTIHSPHSKYSA